MIKIRLDIAESTCAQAVNSLLCTVVDDVVCTSCQELVAFVLDELALAILVVEVVDADREISPTIDFDSSILAVDVVNSLVVLILEICVSVFLEELCVKDFNRIIDMEDFTIVVIIQDISCANVSWSSFVILIFAVFIVELIAVGDIIQIAANLYLIILCLFFSRNTRFNICNLGVDFLAVLYIQGDFKHIKHVFN